MKHNWRLPHNLAHIDPNSIVVYLLRTHPEILVDRKNNPDPWNRVQQHQNIKVSVKRWKIPTKAKLINWLPDLRSSSMPCLTFMQHARIWNAPHLIATAPYAR